MGIGGGGESSSKTWKETITRTVELGYLQTLQAIDLRESSSSNQNSTDSGMFSSSTETGTTISSGETVKRTWWKTKQDRQRFAIGIRDIGVYAYTYAETSESVSLPYISPKPIEKIGLVVDEVIPYAFYSDPEHKGTENDWIKYYISTDNATSWHRISPQDHRDTLSENGVDFVPKIININSDVAKEDRTNPRAFIDAGINIYEVRLRIVLSRPNDIRNAEQYSPTLRSYSILIYPSGGLR